MFNNRTVVVIGAGASNEAGLPTGAGLKDEIAKLLDIRFERGFDVKSGDLTIIEALRVAAKKATNNPNINMYLPACRRIRDAMPQAMSIDNFIDVHSGDKNIELCGKLGIARAILKAEKSCKLRGDVSLVVPRLDFKAVEKTWYNSFLQLLAENCPSRDLPARLASLTLIIFNYDRCVEHFLYYALQNYYGMSGEEAASLIGSISIFHPYGTVGPLPWQRQIGGIEFGDEPSPAGLLEVASQLKTFTEGTDPDASHIVAIRESMLEAKIVVFLGFAFHRLNMQLLIPSIRPSGSPPRVFATAKGMSKSDSELVQADLARLLGLWEREAALVRHDLSCSELFREYWRSLSLS
jgi:hypothetical protein